MALVVAAQKCVFIRQLLLSLAIVLEKVTKMFEDNNSCISLANNPMTTDKTKHIDVRYHFIRDMVKSGSIQLVWCKTEDMLADALTQFYLPTTTHQRLVSFMMTGVYGGTTLVYIRGGLLRVRYVRLKTKNDLTKKTSLIFVICEI